MSVFVTVVPFTTAEERIRFARKLAVLIIRDIGRAHYADVTLAAYWIRDNRAALPSRLSLGGAMRLQEIKRKRELDRQLEITRAYWHAAMDAPDVPMPLIFSHEGYDLRQLTTPHHLVDTGIEADNCLSYRVRDSHFPNQVYWLQVRDGVRHIFTLRHAGVLLVVFSIASSCQSEIQYLTRGKDIADVLKRCIPAIEAVMACAVPVSFHRLLENGQAVHGPPHQRLTSPPASTNDNAPVRP